MTTMKWSHGSQSAIRVGRNGPYVSCGRLLAARALLTLAATALLTLVANGVVPLSALADPGGVAVVAQGQGTQPRELQPRYEPAPPEEKSWYNATYIFGLTRSVAYMPWSPAAKVPLFVLTLPLDVAFLPFAAIGGLFG